nr:2A [anativirus A1]
VFAHKQGPVTFQ